MTILEEVGIDFRDAEALRGFVEKRKRELPDAVT